MSVDVVGCRWNVKMAANWGFSSRRWLTVSSLVAARNSFGTRCRCGPFPQTQFDFGGKNREEEETKQFIAMDFR